MATQPAQSRAEMLLELEAKRQAKLDEKVNSQLNTLMLILAVVYPLIGLVWGTTLLLRKSGPQRIQGAWLFLAATAGIILWWLIWKAWGGQIVRILLPQSVNDLLSFLETAR